MGVIEKFHEWLKAVLPALGIKELYEAQKRAAEAILGGHHVLIVAPTGSGKTEAALLPVVFLLLQERSRGGVRVVYVTPLRALNRDLELRVKRIAEAVGLRVAVRHGDTGQKERREFLKDPPDIAITTPESLTFLLTLRDHREIWSEVGWVIVDELQEMLESERGAELAVTLERLEKASRRRVQRVGLSATLSPWSIGEAQRFLSPRERAKVVLDPEAKLYDLRIEAVEWEGLLERMKEIIERDQTLIFTNTRSLAEEVGVRLGELNASVHHGSLERRVREEAEKAFREGKLRALVATSSMELGIDIGSIGLVIQVLSPRQVVRLVQRVGRAGHRRGAVSRAAVLTIDNVFEIAESLVIAARAERGLLEDVESHRKPYDVLAHQLAAMVVEGSATTLEDAYKIVRASHPFRDLSIEEMKKVAEHLDKVGALRLRQDGSLRKTKRTHSYLYSVTMIPDERLYSVIDIVSERKVGELSDVYVEWELMNTPRGRRPLFVLAGKVWEALEVDVEGERVLAKPTASVEGPIPYWLGELIPVSSEVAQEVCDMLSEAMRGRGGGEIGRVSKRALEALRETAKMWKRAISHREVVVERLGVGSILYVCLGSRGNLALALLLSSLTDLGAVGHISMPYAIVFDAPAEEIASALEKARKLSDVERAGVVLEAVRSTKAFRYRFYHVAVRMGAIEPGARAPISLKNLADNYAGSVVEEETMRELLHEKLDLHVLNRFFEELRRVEVVSGPSPLAEEVLKNPYVRRDVVAHARQIALDLLVESKKRALLNKRVLMVCYNCGRKRELTVSEIGEYRCPYCRSIFIVPLLAGEEGARVAEAIWRRAKSREGKAVLTKEDEELLKRHKAKETAELHASYYMYSKYLVMALMTRGVGPEWAKKAMSALMSGGERAFIEALLELEERYITTREYWEK
ncbi:MAG: DEAD/DEAH box helicase [Acidilobaceae archaeon]|nr:DEAD/DEAH box helicase [Acidilobaceae archaeon]